MEEGNAFSRRRAVWYKMLPSTSLAQRQTENMFEHPILNAIRLASFTPLGWFEPRADDTVPLLRGGHDARFIILIGNAGPAMFHRFVRERGAAISSLDGWCRLVVDRLAEELDAMALFPFDQPPLPFLRWAKRTGSAFRSPLGLNIHPDYGLWHAYRAALTFPVTFDIPPVHGKSPCETCAEKPCLSACPVGAFDGASYDVEGCTDHIASADGSECMSGGCLARRACPVGRQFIYEPTQAQFHMNAFLRTRLARRAETG
jgi:hypothetical protein